MIAIMNSAGVEIYRDSKARTTKSAVECAVKAGLSLRHADLGGADLGGADLRGADLREADLHGAYLHGADLREAYLPQADLRWADLRGADLSETCRRNTSLDARKEGE